MQMNFNRRPGILFYGSQCLQYRGNFLIFSPCSSAFFPTPTLWQMVPHKSHTQISSQGNASLLLKRGTNVRWIWDEFALWIKFTGPRWLLPRVYQETTILLYFISYNSERIFYILAPEECRVEGNVMQSSSGYWTRGQTVNTARPGYPNKSRKRIRLFQVRLISAAGVIVTQGDRIHLC